MSGTYSADISYRQLKYKLTREQKELMYFLVLVNSVPHFYEEN